MRRLLGVVAVGGFLVAACSDGDQARRPLRLQVERVVADGDRPGSPFRGPWMASLGGRLLAVSSDGDPREPPLVVSHDDGRTWEPVDLPRRPAELSTDGGGSALVVDARVAVFAGHDLAPAAPGLAVGRRGIHVWTSEDGARWRLHELDTETAVVDTPHVLPVGDVLVVATAQVEPGSPLVLHTSNDAGSTWRRAAMTGVPPAFSGAVVPVVSGSEDTSLLSGSPHDPSLPPFLLRSTDGGSSWSAEPCGEQCRSTADQVELDVNSGRPLGERAEVLEVVALEEGWLATATSGEDDAGQGHLLRSEDGRHWEEVLVGERCTTLGSSVGTPVEVDGRWYVATTCGTSSAAPRSQLFRSDADAQRFEPIAGTDREDETFGPPVLHGGTLLYPEVDDDRRLVAITRVTARP